MANKVNKGCTAAPVRLGNQDAGWAAPSAEVLYAQEMWSSYHQFHQHNDDLSRMTDYDLRRLHTEMGTTTLRDLQSELLLRPPGTSFHERFLRHLATMNVWLSPPPNPNSPDDILSLTRATKVKRETLVFQIKQGKAALAILPKAVPEPRNVTEAKAHVAQVTGQLSLLMIALK